MIIGYQCKHADGEKYELTYDTRGLKRSDPAVQIIERKLERAVAQHVAKFGCSPRRVRESHLRLVEKSG